MNIETGLNNDEVIKNRSLYGKNVLTKKNKNTFFNLFLDSLNDPIIKILLIALAVKIVFLFKSSNIFETIGIVISVLLASLISSISEYGSEKAFERLEEESSKIKCKVKRESKIIEINIEDVVKNDVVILNAGDKVPADGVIVKGNVSTDESSITGESTEVLKKMNMKVYKGTIVTSGSAFMLVTSVGDDTYYGSLASYIQEYSPTSPLKLRLRSLASFISKVGYFGAFLVSISYLINVILVKNNFDIIKIENMITNMNVIVPHILYALTLAVTIIVLAVPEGLPMMITLVLSSNMKRMLKSNVLVRKLVGIETAGSLNILFTDKTGTLTLGKLKVNNIDICNKKYKKISEIKCNKLSELIKLSLFYNNESKYSGDNIIGGNTTDKSILEYVGKIDDKYNILEKELFNSENKYSSVTLDYDGKTKFIKGAYEMLLNKCNYYYDENGEIKSIYDKKEICERINEEAKLGNRILIMCVSKNDMFILLGFIYLKDIIRKESLKGIELVTSAKIKVVMITGDSKETAIAIGKELNMLNENDIVLTSEELKNMTDDEVKKVLPNLKILSRALPEDKKRLVILAEEMDLVTGMTGDGINDAPALKKADVGFAMGSGTEVAKEVSDIIILDDNFLSISSAILFGRTIFKSIRKFIIFQLTINFCAVFLSIVGPYIGILNPITVIQMLWVNMVMDTFAALAFSYEAPLVEYMYENPKKKDEKIVNKYMIGQIIYDGIYCSMLCIMFLKLPFINSFFRVAYNDKYLLTAFFALFIFLSIFNMFNARTHRINIFASILKNKVFIYIILFIALVEFILIYYGGEVFRTSGLTSFEMTIMLILSFSVIPIDAIRKLFLRIKKIEDGV